MYRYLNIYVYIFKVNVNILYYFNVRIAADEFCEVRFIPVSISQFPPRMNVLSCVNVQVFLVSCSGRCGRRATCLAQLTWNLKKNLNSSSRSSTPICHVSFFYNSSIVNSLLNCIHAGIEQVLSVSGPSPEVVAEDEDDGAELEEEELESVQVSETQFNFLDFIKK